MVEPLFACTESVAYGDVVAIPRAPEVGSLKEDDVAGSVPKIKLPILSWLSVEAFAKNVLTPMAMLLSPELLLYPELKPRKVLPKPVPFPNPAYAPTAVFAGAPVEPSA